MSDAILMEGIQLPAAVGVTSAERAMRRPVLIDLKLELNLKDAGELDDLLHTADYQKVYDMVAGIVSHSEFKLVEALGERICKELLVHFPISTVHVRVRKAKPLAGIADLVGIEMTRVDQSI